MNPANPSTPRLSCEPGQPWPMGASCVTLAGSQGVNFAVYSRHAERLEVCLYDARGEGEIARFTLPVCTNGIWHGFVAGLAEGQLYGLRAHGPYQPEQGHRFNPAKLLIDPFARDLVGSTVGLAMERGYRPPEDGAVPTLALDALPDPGDNAARIPKARVLDLEAQLQAGAAMTPRPQRPAAHMVLYEAHVKGLTQRHPEVPEALRGSYAGLVSEPMLAHYRRLGITTLCLLPVHLHISEAHLLQKGLSNYWGYNTLGFFIPEPSYASGQYRDVRTEFRYMVDQLHRHGLEVVLDVVYNHSAESDGLGPTLSWRGLDNASWYALDAHGTYLNHSGCGNSLNLAQPHAVQWVMDSLRWWVQAFGVDGFRFDLATALGRDPEHQYSFHPLAGLLTAITQDPLLGRVKLIAEPWDVGPDGYKLGQFPPGWHEWNDRFRDTSRAFWLGFDCTCGDFARRLTGSSDLFDHAGRNPLASVNLITAHDGMTLADLTAYRRKHNQPNGEDNRDGQQNNHSTNAGVEGPTHDAAVLAVRGQWRRALLATLFCAQGVPQLLAGDELGHSQSGNNNAYCQDNETSWLDWQDADPGLIDFVANLIHLRQTHVALRHARWFTGQLPRWPLLPDAPADVAWDTLGQGADIAWRKPDGSALTATDWEDPQARSFGCLIELAEHGQTPTQRWLLMFHAGAEPAQFALPAGRWLHVLDSAAALVLDPSQWGGAKTSVDDVALPPRSVFAMVQKLGSPT
nr:glycogen debranching protein GlgX [Rhodoferax sp.]